LDLNDINKKVDRIDKASDAEKQKSPQIVQKSKASRPGGGGGNNTRRAFCKTAAPAGLSIDAYLDTDGTGQQVNVLCSVAGGGWLNGAIPLLTDGLEIAVFSKLISGTTYWFCCTTFQTMSICV